MCELCEENGGEMIGCQDCGCSICYDVPAGDDVIRRAYVTESGDLFCSQCGLANDRRQLELDEEGWLGMEDYPEDWYDEDSDLDELEDTPQTRQIGPGGNQT
jgi:hypothetical protein